MSRLRVVYLVLLFGAAAVTLKAQPCAQKLADLPEAPEFLGFRLGMTKEEIKARVPQTVFGRTDDFGVSKTTINPYFDPRIDKTKFESVRSISLDLLDERLVSLWIGYDETFKVQAVEDFVKLVSESLKVPTNWTTWKGRGQQLRCADFQLQVTTVARGPSIRILNIPAEDLIATRRREKEERDSLAQETKEDEEEVIADKQTKFYFPTTCQVPRVISETNKITFKTAEEAEKAGFKLAKGCQ